MCKESWFAKVDAKGNVIAKKKGTAVIKAVVTLKNGKKKTLEIKYKVNKRGAKQFALHLLFLPL